MWRGAFALLLSLLLPGSAMALSDLEQAREDFVCDPEAETAGSELPDDGFDENGLPDILRQEPKETPTDEELADAPEVANEFELEAWRGAAARYRERAREFATEVDRVIRRKYDEEILELRRGYEAMISGTDDEEREMRRRAIVAHENFVDRHPDSGYTARRMFRLAELYFEESEEIFIEENEEYDKTVDAFDAGEVDYLPEPPQKDLRKSIALYKQIIKRFKDYEDLGVVYYTLGYCYSDESSKHLDPERAEQTYLALLDNVKESPYRAQAYFRLGDLYFEENQHNRALAYYAEIVEEFERRAFDELTSVNERLYELALYKLAWAYYKVDDLDIAINLFMNLLEWAERKEARTGKVADLRPEAVRYLAISYADLAVEGGSSPIEFALQSLEQRRGASWAFEVLVELASILRDQARFEDAIAAYHRLQELQPNHPLGPEFQNNIIVLNQNLVVPDPDAAAAARVQLTNRYGLDGAWYAANKNNKAATSLATRHILESLQWVAYAYHSQAQESDDPNDYLAAARKYLEYLERYPFAENAYELNYNLADCYFWIGENRFQDATGVWTTGWEEAIKQYASLFGFPETEHREDSILGIMFSYNYLWKQDGGDVTQIPEALANINPPLGQRVQYSIVPLTDLEKNYIRAVRWVQREVPSYDGMAVLLYDLGQIYFYKNHLQRSRNVFMELVEDHPATDFASFGAGHIVDSYKYTGDLVRMRDAGERFAMLELGEDAGLREERNELFSTLARKSLFKDGELAYGLGRYECAILSFLEYFELYGDEGTDKDPRDLDLIVYNIALSYSKLGKAPDSTRYYELLLDRFPHSAQAPRTFWKMAQNYEQLFELEKAVQYYQDLIRYHPDHEDVADALYNSGFLAIGLKRFADAATTYERYHETYPDKEESKLLLFRAGELWESAGEQKKAARLFTNWMERYGETDADRWVETQFKLAGFAEDRGKDRDAARLLQSIKESFPVLREDLVANGGSLGLKITASLRFEEVREEYDQYVEFTFPNTQDQEELQAALARKIEWNQEVSALMDEFVIQYPDFEWQTAALYYKALSFQNHGLTWINAPNPYDPDDMDEEELYFVYQDLLLEKAQPFEDTAVQLFKSVVDFARSKKRHTQWVDKALRELSRSDPNAYPVPKPDESTVMPADSVTLPKPLEPKPEATSALPLPQGERLVLRGGLAR